MMWQALTSRDHRPDCEQLVMALIVNQDGFPFSYPGNCLTGNRADVSTVEAILRTVERKHGKARRVWIFDRGVVSEENLVAIRKRWGASIWWAPQRSKAEAVRTGTTSRMISEKDPTGSGGQADHYSRRQRRLTSCAARRGRKEKEKAIRSRFLVGDSGEGNRDSGLIVISIPE